jgi:type IV pilus assembly protein PilC
MLFKFKAQKTTGEIVDDIREANDKFALFDDLKKEGMTLISAEPQGRGKIFTKDLLTKGFSIGSVPMHQKIIFAKNLGAMLEAGLSLSRCLAVIERQTSNTKLKTTISDLNEMVKKGMSFSEALAKFPKIFPSIFVSIVKAGEEGGNLSNSLKVITSQLERTFYIQRKVRGALMYPSVIIALIIIIAALMMVVVVPKLTVTFKELNIELPMTTRIVIFISDFLKDHFVWAIVLAFASVVIVKLFAKSPIGKKFFDWFFLKVPGFGPLIAELNTARAARTMSSLLSSGVNMVGALEITGDVVQNTYFKRALIKAKENIQKGSTLSSCFSEKGSVYPAFFSEMISAGEETGNLSSMLSDVSEFYEKEVDEKTKDFSAIIEPVIMIMVGVAVGFFALAMLSPMYSMGDAIK